MAKSEKMIIQGWSTDTCKFMNNHAKNAGFVKRRALFLKTSEGTSDTFSELAIPIIGALNTDFQTVTTGQFQFT